MENLVATISSFLDALRGIWKESYDYPYISIPHDGQWSLFYLTEHEQDKSGYIGILEYNE